MDFIKSANIASMKTLTHIISNKNIKLHSIQREIK